MANERALWKAAGKAALDLLYPSFCIGCGKEGTFICPDCLKAIPLQDGQVCPYCYVKNDSGMVCVECRGEMDVERGENKITGGAGLDGLVSASVYTEKTLMAEAIHSLKYDFVRDLSVPLAGILAKSADEQGLREYALCPVPLHKKRLTWRGFNQSALLAERIAELLSQGGGKIFYGLERISFTKPQMELKKDERVHNVKNSFSCSNARAPAKKVLLVDDVATTLSTLNECAKALKSAGALEVKAIVLARSY